MSTATTAQITFIKNLLADHTHTDTGKTILIGETRFRTTTDKLAQISAAVASRMITALKNSPMKPAEERTPEGPHFRNLFHTWMLAGVKGGQRGDIIEVHTKSGETRTVALGEKTGVMWSFTNIEQTPTAEVATEQPSPAPRRESPRRRPAYRRPAFSGHRTSQASNTWEAAANRAGRAHGVNGQIWDE